MKGWLACTLQIQIKGRDRANIWHRQKIAVVPGFAGLTRNVSAVAVASAEEAAAGWGKLAGYLTDFAENPQ